MRKYQPIWEQIKLHNKVSLAADPSLHDRIIMAVIKEKKKDVGWELLLLEQNKRKRLRSKVEGSMITFILADTPLIRLTDL